MPRAMERSEKDDRRVDQQRPAFYAVKSTGIFCRMSCKSRRPLPENVRYFESAEAAVDAGYRPCKRCRPDLSIFRPIQDIAVQVKAAIDQHYGSKNALAETMQKLGVSNHRIAEVFKQEYGLSPNQYKKAVQMKHAQKQLRESTESITDIAYSLGFESISAFYSSFGKSCGMTPKEFRARVGKSLIAEDCTTHVVETEFGPLTIVSNGEAVVRLQFGRGILAEKEMKESALIARAADELREYFSGRRTRFTIPLAPQGTTFQKEVWTSLCQIPYGETRAYKDIAADICKPGASRAVGMANNKNPILIMIPCHRVIYANGALGGYAGSIDLKEKLLIHEKENKAFVSVENVKT